MVMGFSHPSENRFRRTKTW